MQVCSCNFLLGELAFSARCWVAGFYWAVILADVLGWLAGRCLFFDNFIWNGRDTLAALLGLYLCFGAWVEWQVVV
jgi:hypothetical protein